MKLLINDLVQVRSWKSMQKQYGLNSDGNIRIPITFSQPMHIFCKTKFTIKEFDEVDIVHQGKYFSPQTLDLILTSPKLTLKLSQRGLKLKVKILEQDESLRGNLDINEGKYSLFSESFPEFDGRYLFVRGIDKDRDNDKLSHTYQSQADLDSFVEALRVMMEDFALAKSEKLR